MRKICFTAAALILLSCFVNLAWAKPVAVVENTVFVFDSVPEGVQVAHNFTIRNSGDTTLHITGVRPP